MASGFQGRMPGDAVENAPLIKDRTNDAAYRGGKDLQAAGVASVLSYPDGRSRSESICTECLRKQKGDEEEDDDDDDDEDDGDDNEGGDEEFEREDVLINDQVLLDGETDEEEEEETIVPDGGWGWVVCLGSFVVNFVLDGTLFSFGVLLLYLLDDFGEDKATTAWVGSAQMGVHMCMGPLISALLKRFTVRQVTIAGSLLSTLGFIASVFSPNVYVLILTYGVIGGIGFGMVFLPAIIVVGLYFNRKRAIATGIATSGSGVGTFAYAYITDILLESYGWRGTVLILAGLLLHCAVCGMLFRPLLTVRYKRPKSLSASRTDVQPSTSPPETSSKDDDHSASSGYSSQNPTEELSKPEDVAGNRDAEREINANDGGGGGDGEEVDKSSRCFHEQDSALSTSKSALSEIRHSENEDSSTPKSQVGNEESKGGCCEKYDVDNNTIGVGNNNDHFPDVPTPHSHGVSISRSDHCDCERARSSSVRVGETSDCVGGRTDADGGGGNTQMRHLPVPTLMISEAPCSSNNNGSSAHLPQRQPENGVNVNPGKHLRRCPCCSAVRRGSYSHAHGSRDGISPNEKHLQKFIAQNREDVKSLSSSNKKLILPWFYKDVEPTDGVGGGSTSGGGGSGCGGLMSFKLKPLGRLYKSVDHIHHVAEKGGGGEKYIRHHEISAPLTTPRLLSSEYKLNDFTDSRAMSLFGLKNPHDPGSEFPNRGGGHTGSRNEVVQTQMYKGLIKPILRKDIYYSGSVNHLPAYQHFGGSLTTFMAAMTRSSSAEDNDVIAMAEKDEACSGEGSRCCTKLKRILPMKLLGNYQFLLLLITFTMWTAQSVSLTYLPDLAVSLNIGRSDAAFLISIVGIANVLGRLLAGFITDCFRLPSIWLYVVALLMAAVTNLAFPFCNSYIFLQISCAVFGLCMAVAVSMRTIVLAEQLGIEVLTESFGVVALFQGMAFTVNPPVAGKLIDDFSSFKPPFIMAATMYAISALCSILVGCSSQAAARRRRRDIATIELEVTADEEDGSCYQDSEVVAVIKTTLPTSA
ncbi:uncharacterized protein LOC101856201 [Aplysia californica]|uniref:Uncharacterized protein LOC101856201 n=1 Tax=Aplysia californica TaxID=6500 RepID=A0ABM0JY47_APLCA|nr:uncharacterized protein LOC101856201 [Aplysia californica]